MPDRQAVGIILPPFFVEGILILRNSSLKLKTVVDNAILLNYAVSSENISERIKIKLCSQYRLTTYCAHKLWRVLAAFSLLEGRDTSFPSPQTPLPQEPSRDCCGSLGSSLRGMRRLLCGATARPALPVVKRLRLTACLGGLSTA